MIQRIQSVYLLLAAILMAATVCTPLAILFDMQHYSFYLFKSTGLFENATILAYPTYAVAVLAAVAALLSFVTIFLFKKRKVQIKLCYILLLVIVLFYAVFAIYLYTALGVLNIEFSKVLYGLALPAISFVLTVLALSKIKADEKLIQSLNRIR